MSNETTAWHPLYGENHPPRPLAGTPVLVTDGREIWKSEWFADAGWELEDVLSGEPTHWMPLPPLPGQSA